MGNMRKSPSAESRERSRKIGNRLRFLRQEADMTLVEVAEEMGVKFQTIHKYETGEIAVSMERAEQLAQVFGVTPQDILGWRQAAA